MTRNLSGKQVVIIVANESEDLDWESIDCLFFPGGFPPDYVRRDQRLLALVRSSFEQGKVVGGDLPRALGLDIRRDRQQQARHRLSRRAR